MQYFQGAIKMLTPFEIRQNVARRLAEVDTEIMGLYGLSSKAIMSGKFLAEIQTEDGVITCQLRVDEVQPGEPLGYICYEPVRS